MAAGLQHIEEQVKGVEQAVTENTGLAFDLSKTLIESACKTILTERGIGFNSDDDLPALFRTATQQLPFLPPAAASDNDARNSLNRTIGGLHTALQGVCELRNTHGFASHGTDRHRPTLGSAQALLAAQTADAIVGFLHRVHRQERARLPRARLEYEHNPAFNEYVDQANEAVRIFQLEYKPSEVLFRVDQEGYRDSLAGFSPEGDDGAEQPAAELGSGVTS
jgi:hypothetical protein